MSESAGFDRAIAELESLRPSLGDAAVDAAIAGIRARMGRSPTDHERKLATVLFADIVGSTAITERLDPEDNLAVMEAKLARMSFHVESHGGRVTRYMGDGLLAIFGHPIATGDDGIRAVRASLDMIADTSSLSAPTEGVPLEVRVGIASGVVVIGGETEAENTLSGAVVNLAARLQAAARPGSVLIDSETHQLSRGEFEVASLGPVDVAGFTDPVVSFEVQPKAARLFSSVRLEVGGTKVPMVGRSDELAQLIAAHDESAGSADVRMVTIVGPPGMGKSRLLREMVAAVGQTTDGAVLWSRGKPELSTTPYALLRGLFDTRLDLRDDSAPDSIASALAAELGRAGLDLAEASRRAMVLGRLLGYDLGDPSVPPSTDPQTLRDQGLGYLADYFRSQSASEPLLVILEDLHWADESSLAALEGPLTAPRDVALTIVASARPELYEKTAWMSRRPGHHRLDLAPLDSAATGEMIDRIFAKVRSFPGSVRDFLIANSEGNPFFVEEFANAMIDHGVIAIDGDSWSLVSSRLREFDPPTTLSGLLQARLDRLPPPDRVVLQRGSVVGRMFWEPLVASMRHDGDLDERTVAVALEGLAAREMVFLRPASSFEEAAEYAFKHSILRDVVYEGVLKRTRAAHHSRTADWLRSRTGVRKSEWAAIVAGHLIAADRPAEAIPELLLAVEEARSRYANEEAIGLLDLRESLLSDSADLFALAMEREELARLTGQRERQRRDIELLRSLADPMTSGERTEVLYREARFHLETGNYEEAIEFARSATEAAELAGIPRVVALAGSTWSKALVHTGRTGEAVTVAHRSLVAAEAAGDQAILSEALTASGLIEWDHGRPDRAAAMFERALEIDRDRGDRRAVAASLNNLAVTAMERGDLVGAEHRFQQALATASEIGDRFRENAVLNNLGIVLADMGRLDEAEALYRSAIEISDTIEDPYIACSARLNMSLVESMRGDPIRAIEFARAAAELASTAGLANREAFALHYLGIAELRSGRPDAAVASFRAARRLDVASLELDAAAGLGLALAMVGDRAAASAEAVRLRAAYRKDPRLQHADQPTLTLLHMHRLLALLGEADAREVLGAAGDALLERQLRMNGLEQRRAIGDNIAWHREIRQAEAEAGLLANP